MLRFVGRLFICHVWFLWHVCFLSKFDSEVPFMKRGQCMGNGPTWGGNGAVGLGTVKIADGDPLKDNVGEPLDRTIGGIGGSGEIGPIRI